MAVQAEVLRVMIINTAVEVRVSIIHRMLEELVAQAACDARMEASQGARDEATARPLHQRNESAALVPCTN